MKKLIPWGLGLLALVAAVTIGCVPSQPTPPIDIDVSQNATQIVNPAPNPSPSASPGSGMTTVDRVFVGDYGENCQPPLAPATGPNEVRIGCVGILTCTPFDKNGNAIPKGQHAAAPDFFGVIYGADLVDFHQTDEELFNAHVKINKAGTSTYACTVQGVQTRNPLTLTHVP